jgi:hypothetical protein
LFLLSFLILVTGRFWTFKYIFRKNWCKVGHIYSSNSQNSLRKIVMEESGQSQGRVDSHGGEWTVMEGSGQSQKGMGSREGEWALMVGSGQSWGRVDSCGGE